MSYAVTKSSPVLVPPAASTPTGILPLSSLDNFFHMRLSVKFISVFLHGEQVGKRIKEAFSKALVPYYPVAGRIAEPTPGFPVVDCTGEGIWFIEATANCSLEDVNYLEMPLIISKEEMLPQPPSSVKLEDQILMAQITQFTCGGFAVGIWFSHLVFDGQGAGQFLKAVGDMARGLPEPTVKPVWSREAIRDAPKVPFSGPPPSLTAFNMVRSIIDISHNNTNRIKDKFTTETANKCSSFEVVSAMIIKSCAKTFKLADATQVVFLFVTSMRHLLHAILPSMEGYYGNCLDSFWISKTIEEMNNASLVDVITLIKDAKDARLTEFADWMKSGNICSNAPMDHRMVIVSDWRWVGFNEVDYGWGEPKYVFPLDHDENNVSGGVVYLQTPMPKQGIRLMLRCVEKEHSTEFCDNLLKF